MLLSDMRFGVLADIHGNALALEAVLQDIDTIGLKTAVNLGDFFSGPLDAAETANLLVEQNFPSIRGNHDRNLIEQKRSDMGPSDKVAFDQLDKTHLDWIAGLPETRTVFGDAFLCHGTPKNDSTYWLERVETDGTVRSAKLKEIQAEAEGVDASLILCAHTHIPRCIRLPDGRTIVNPGSVGCPAYDDDVPVITICRQAHQMRPTLWWRLSASTGASVSGRCRTSLTKQANLPPKMDALTGPDPSPADGLMNETEVLIHSQLCQVPSRAFRTQRNDRLGLLYNGKTQ